MMAISQHNELFEGVVNQLIDEEALGVCFEMHRAIKLGYYELLYPDDSVYEKQPIVNQKGLDIFGNDPQSLKKNVDCTCPNCGRTLGAQKFAPHLEKCMGMGRNSSRLANKKQKTPVDSEQEPSDDNEDEWTYPERKPAKKLKKEKVGSFSSPGRVKSGRGPGRPPKHPRVEDTAPNPPPSNLMELKPSLQQHNVASFSSLPSDYKRSLLQQICGVVSERTGRLCTRSINCPQHSEDQRSDVRSLLLRDRRSSDVITPPPAKRSKDRSHKPSPDLSEELDVETHYQPSHAHYPSSDGGLLVATTKKKKSKSGKRSKKGHNSGGGGSGSSNNSDSLMQHSTY